MRIAEGRVVVTAHESAGGIYRIVRIVGDNKDRAGQEGAVLLYGSVTAGLHGGAFRIRNIVA